MFVAIDQLQVGLYIQLDLDWMEHPFGFNSFKIKNEDQIRVLRQLGLEKVRYDPNRSSAKPLPPHTVSGTKPQPVTGLTRDDPQIQAKLARAEYLAHYRDAVRHAERELRKAAHDVHNIYIKLPSHPAQARAEAEALIEHVIRTFLAEPDATIHALGGKENGDALYHHGLNVTVLSMIMAKGLGMSMEDCRMLGLGALFHDMGLSEVPARILQKTEPLTAAEFKLRQMHCAYGVTLGKRIGLPAAALNIIGQHHEMMDGSGYPDQLKGEEIAPMARLVQVANRYDSLCNPTMPAKLMTPHEALSFMFAQQSAKHDPIALRMLIRSLGVYPPGTAVHLSNGATALVTSVNPLHPLKPTLVVYEPSVPKDEAIIVDLEQEADVHIANALNPNQLPRIVCDYLCMRRHVSYYFGEGGAVKA